MSVLTDSVGQADDGTWFFQCPGVKGDPCSRWSSRGWPTKKVALARGRQHFDEHVGTRTGTPAVSPSLDEFRQEQGLAVNDDGSVSVEDL